MRHVNVKIRGKIKNTGIRFHVMSEAYRFHINGEVKRINDELIEIDAEGPEIPLMQFLEWCKIGPPGCIFENVQFTDREICYYTSFNMV